MKKATIKIHHFIQAQHVVFLFMFCFVAGKMALGQSTTESLNKKLGIYVFPAKDQSAEQKQKDESYCYEWAVKNSGVDPLNMQAVKPDTVKAPSTGQGMVVGGAK